MIRRLWHPAVCSAFRSLCGLRDPALHLPPLLLLRPFFFLLLLFPLWRTSLVLLALPLLPLRQAFLLPFTPQAHEVINPRFHPQHKSGLMQDCTHVLAGK
jgi:hypothetical protein